MFQITEKENYISVPSVLIGNVKEELQKQNIEHEVLHGADIPLECDGPFVELDNRRFTRFVCLKARVNPEDIKAYEITLLK